MGKAFGHRSAKSNFFQTPYSITQSLLDRERFIGNIHEPCSGEGAIKRVLEKNKYTVSAADISTGQDFLKDPVYYDNIITNPPYGSITDDIVLHAKSHIKHKVAMLLRTNYLSGTTRYNKGIFNKLEKIYIFTRMPDLRAPIREDGKYPTAMIVYAWFIWDMDYLELEHPVISWIDNQKFVLKKGE